MSRFRVGQQVERCIDGDWYPGTVEDVFRGPVSGLTVYDVGGWGFYEHELRLPLSGAVLEAVPVRELEGMRLDTLLGAVPKMGPVKVRQLLRRHGLDSGRTLGSLSVRQRGLLADEFRRPRSV